MNYIDIIIFVLLGFGAFSGFRKGLVVEIFTLLGLLLGVYLAIRCSYYTEGFLKDFLDINTQYLRFVALTVTFLLVAVGVYLLGKLLTKLVDAIALGLLNKTLGMLLGTIKYFLIVCVLLLVVNVLDETFSFMSEELRQKSLLYNPFLNFAQKMYNMIRF